ncbi:MAG: protein translocase subunit SecDF [Bacteroidales bacterium]|nr:protein translocase subunit SecDF [Bacteroidales bacterium]
MRNKGFILFLAITLGIICIYSLSFTYCTRNVENKSKKYASDIPNKETLLAQAEGNPFIETYLLDSVYKARENEYLQKMSDSVVYNLLVAKWTYKECKELELNLGLDLRGGMNVMLEVSVPNIITSLAGNGAKDSLFVKTMRLATEKQRRSQADFITLFEESFKEVAPQNARLSTIFRKLELSQNNPTNENVIKALREETEAALSNTFMILRTRIDRFGVTQPNIQRLPQSGRIMIELPGVKEPERVRKLLQGSANLEFWKTYEFSEIQDYFVQINDRLAEIKAVEKEGTENDSNLIDTNDLFANTIDTTDTTSLASENNLSDTSFSLSETGASTPDGQMTVEEQAEKYPLFAILYPNDRISDDGKLGPLVGYTHEKDTAEVNRIFNLPWVKSLLPQDLRLVWHAKTGKDKSPVHQLIALKAVGEKGSVLDGSVVVDARQDFNERAGNEISMTMNANGAKMWKKITEENIGNSIAIVLDNLVYSYPVVNDVIPNGRSSITGAFSLEEAKDLANLLKAGKLPAPAVIVSEEIVGPTLGKESIHDSMISFLVAFCLILLYMIFFYNRAGIVAGIALILNFLIVMGCMTSLGAVLTLPGIAGMVLSLGMAVDANVIIYERIREELRAGKGSRLAIADGFKAAYSAIIDGNLTTILTGIILFIFGSGPVQGFAVTLIIGIISSMFTAIFVSRLIFTWLLDHNKAITYSNTITEKIFTNLHFDFIGKRKIFYVLSCVILGIGVVSLFVKGLDYGIDFTGGRSYTVRFDQAVKADEIRESLTKSFDGVAPEVKTFGSDKQMKITTNWRIDENSSEIDSIAEQKLYEGLKPFFKTEVSKKDFGVQNQSVGIISALKVGAVVSRDITRGAILSVFFALIGIFIYIAFRFRNWRFALGGVLALGHDTLFTIGMFSIFHGIFPFTMEVDQNFIAAILTIIGFSINDTVIIFDRIREYKTLYPKRGLRDNINQGINSTLGRTINTSGIVFLTVLAIFIFGGDVLRGFIFALMMGIVIGSYSTIFIGTPIAYDFDRHKHDNEEPALKKA